MRACACEHFDARVRVQRAHPSGSPAVRAEALLNNLFLLAIPPLPVCLAVTAPQGCEPGPRQSDSFLLGCSGMSDVSSTSLARNVRRFAASLALFVQGGLLEPRAAVAVRSGLPRHRRAGEWEKD